MKKFSKLLAVVLAIAVIICPMMIFAETSTSSGTYKIELVDANTVQLTINSTDGFVAYHAIVGFNKDDAFQSSYNDDGYVDGLKVISYTLKTEQANDHNKPTIRAHASGTSLNVIVMPSDTNNLDLCTKIVIGIRVASGATASLTKIQAADNGTVDSDNANLLTFPAAGSDGVIDKNANDYDAANAVAAHVHTVVEDAAVAPTCTETGLTAGSHCSVCNEVLVAQTVVPALGHSFTNYVSNNDATCTADGTKKRTCSECGATETITDVGSALGHTPATAVVENNVPATCTTDGSYDSVVKCSVCKTELSRETVIVKATGHTPATAVEENRVEATCGVDGHYDSVVYCSVCKAEISRTQQTIPATGNHTWGEWTTDADGHSRTCSVCNAVDSGTHNGNPCTVCGYEAAPAGPVKDTNIALQDPCLPNISSGLRIRLRVMRKTLPTGTESVKLNIIPTKYTSTSNAEVPYNEYVAETVVLDAPESSTANYFNFFYDDVDMRELGLSFDVIVDCYDIEGNKIAYSNTFTVSPVDELMKLYNNPSSSAALKNILANLLEMGAKAQVYFAYQSAVAASSDLMADVVAGNLVNKDINRSDLTVNGNSLNIHDPDEVWDVNAPFTSSEHRLATALVLGKTPTIQYSIYKAKTNFDTSKVSLDVSYTSNNGNLVTYTLEGSEIVSFSGTKGNILLRDLAYYDSNVVVTATLKYDNATVWTKEYTVESGINALATATGASENLINLVNAVSDFGDAARNYTGFGK